MRIKSLAVLTAAVVLGTWGCSPTLGPDKGNTDTKTQSLTLTEAIDIQTDHPYRKYTDETWEIQAPEAAVRLHIPFHRFETETYYDTVKIYDANGELIHVLSGALTGQTYSVEGNYAKIVFRSDYSIQAWGFQITEYRYDVVPTHPTDHRPYCGAIGSRSEGWYWGDTNERIKWANCANLSEPQCGAIGSRSEGWYSDDGLITWDRCHRTVGISLWGESCGQSESMTCYNDLYCHGGDPGVCKSVGYCENTADCSAPGNNWVHIMCVGYATCDTANNACKWNCGQPVGTWSWTTVLLQNVESPHPYPNNYENTWDVTRPGAEKIKVYFEKIETERNYDFVKMWGDREEILHVVDGRRDGYWSPEFNGDTIHIALETDYSYTRYGFRATSVSYYELLPPGICNRDEDCQTGEFCNPHQCFNPYAPCYGDCQPRQGGGGTFQSTDTPIEIPDADPAGIESGIAVSGVGNCNLEVKLDVYILHTWRGDLKVQLEDPNGRKVTLHNRQGGSEDNLVFEDFDLTGQLGLDGADGTWHLSVSDNAYRDLGTQDNWALHLTCR
jgi:hypothetical protein